MAAAKVIDRDLVMCFECWLCCGPALSCWVCAHSRERGIESSMCLNRVREFESSSQRRRGARNDLMLKRHASTPSLSPLPRWGSLESGLCGRGWYGDFGMIKWG